MPATMTASWRSIEHAPLTGAGFGGCTVNLVEADAVGALRDAVLADYPGRTGLDPMILPVSAAAGAGIVA